MVESGNLKTLVEPEEPYRFEKTTLLSKYDIPISHLDFDYVTKCKNGKELERILKILQSGEEGYYPDLMRATEERLTDIKPKSKALRKVCPVLRREEVDKDEWNQLSTELNDWADSMRQSNKELKAQKCSGNNANIPTVRENRAKCEQDKKKSAISKRIASTDYESWNKYDVDTEITKMDLEEEKTRKEAVAKLESKSTSRQVTREEFHTNAEAIFEANRAKEKGNEFFKAGDYEEALTHYDRSIFYAPSATTFTNRAITHIKLGKFDCAIDDCKQSLRLDPTNNWKAHLRKAQGLEGLNQYDEAFESVAIAIRINPNNAVAQQLAQKIHNSMKTKTGEKKRLSITDTAEKKTRKINRTTIPIPGTSKMPPPFYKTIDSIDPKIVQQETLKIHNQTPRLIHLTKIEDDANDECIIEHVKSTKKTVAIQIEHDITAVKNQIKDFTISNPNSQKITLISDSGGGGEPCKETDDNQISTNDVNSPYAFLKAWYAIGKSDTTYTKHADILKKLQINTIHEVIGNKLDSKMLSDVLRCLFLHFTVAGEEDRVFEALSNIPLIPRFNIISLFMTESDRVCVQNLAQFLNQHGKTLPEHVVKLYI